MSGREARAFQSDIRGAGARRREVESVKSALRAVDQRAAAQRPACAEEIGQVKEKATADTWQAKLAAKSAAAKLADVRLDGKQRVKQKAADCQAEYRQILGERDEVKASAAASRVVAPKTKATKATKGGAKVARSEARDEVEQNLPPELVPLWRKERAGFRLTPRQADRGTSLTEAFLERVEAEPEAVRAAQEPRRAAPSRADQGEERRVACDRARKEAQRAVAEGPRASSAEVPF